MEKWESTVVQPGINIVRIHAQENERDMVDTFYTYLLGVDTSNRDIPIIFESVYHDNVQYTCALLDELKENIDLWNNSNKDAVTIEVKNIDWSPDFTLHSKNGNTAYPFIENMNRFATHLQLDENIFLVAILKVSFIIPQEFCRWLEDAIKAGMNEKFKILIDDSTDHPFFQKIVSKYPDNIVTLQPELDMDTAMQQVASMGNPNDPAVPYRQSFVKMMQAIEKRKEGDAEKHANVCIDIATENIKKNAYWIGQIVAVYAALANDQVGYKNFKKAISYSTKGVEAAEQSQQLITDEFIHRKLRAQAIMLRASLYAADKEWFKAIEDFRVAAEHYVYTNDTILSMEAYRMMGYCNNKSGNTDEACKSLVDALNISCDIPVHIVKFTTFAGIIDLLLKINNSKYISNMEIADEAEAVYGEDWLEEIKNWNNPHFDQVDDPSKVVVA